MTFPVVTSTEVAALRARRSQVQNAVDFVVTAKKEVGRLWDQDGGLYRQLFPANLSGLRLCRIVRIFRFVDQVLAASESSQSGYYRRMFFRHARYFIMALIAHRSEDIIGRADFELSGDDCNLLSKRIDDLAEAIYQESLPLQSVKGYLAIFRNLTDAQPLADTVIAKLALRDAQLRAAAASPNSPPTP